MNKVIESEDFSLCMIDEKSIKEISRYTQNIGNTGNFFSTKIKHETYWLSKLNNNELWTDRNGYLALVDNKDEVFGIIWHFSHCIENSFEVGINIVNPLHRGVSGFGSKVLKVYCDYLFNAYPINRLQYNMVEENVASEKIANKVGFKYEGLQRKALYIRGKWENLKLYSLLREELENE